MHLASARNSGPDTSRLPRTASGERIERGIPIPERIPFGGKQGQGRPAKVDLVGLGVGDSVFLRAATKPAVHRARMNAIGAAKRAEIKITTRAVEGGLRVWRTA